MKLTQYLLNHSRNLSSFLSIALVASLACAPAAFAKKGGNGGGGGGDDGGGGSLVPPVVLSPVEYISTELRWENEAEFNDPEFQGIFINFINRNGLATGFVKRPAPEGSFGERRAIVNVDPATGEATDTMVDLNELFADSLAALNAQRSDGPWRIAYGRGINDAGMIGCQLLPVDAPARYTTEEAAAAGVEPTPMLHVVVDLQSPEPDGIVVVDPDNTSSDQNIMQLNEHGDVITSEADGAGGYTFSVFRRETDLAGNPSYVEIPLPAASDGFPNFNSSLQVADVENDVSSDTSRLVRYVAGSDDETVWWEVTGESLSPRGIAEDGTAYVRRFYSVSTTRGKRTTTRTYAIPYHVLSPTERIPLTDESAELPNGFRNVSRAAVSGEEEVILRITWSGEFQIYKPNFGARFVLPIDPSTIVGAAFVSPPYDPQAVSSPDSYNGGYVAYSTRSGASLNFNRSFILTPQLSQ